MKFYEKLKSLGYKSYKSYLRSKHWKGVKKKYKQSRRPQFCLVCEDKKYCLHHINYENIGMESLNDVVPLCSGCHLKIHEIHKTYGIPLIKLRDAIQILCGCSKGRANHLIHRRVNKPNLPKKQNVEITILELSDRFYMEDIADYLGVECGYVESIICSAGILVKSNCTIYLDNSVWETQAEIPKLPHYDVDALHKDRSNLIKLINNGVSNIELASMYNVTPEHVEHWKCLHNIGILKK